jgi:hypothetical protein
VDGLRQLFRKLHAAFPDLEITPEQLLSEGDRVAVRLTLRGTHRGEFIAENLWVFLRPQSDEKSLIGQHDWRGLSEIHLPSTEKLTLSASRSGVTQSSLLSPAYHCGVKVLTVPL